MSSEINRKIAVIFVVDAVGYSKHMEVDENGTVHSYNECERILKKFDVNAQMTRFCTYDSDLLYSFRKKQTQNRLVTIIWRRS